MRIFVYEHMTGGGQLSTSGLGFDADSLFREGLAMLRAVVADLSQVAGLEVAVQIDSRLANVDLAGCLVCPVTRSNEELDSFCDAASRSDFTLVIAPEFDGILYRRTQIVEEVGGKLLGPSSGLVGLLADKLALADHLSKAGVPVPRTFSTNAVHSISSAFSTPFVVKPRFGAGSLNVQLIASSPNPNSHLDKEFICQDFVSGTAVSVAALCGKREPNLLPAVTQALSDDGHFRYLGGRFPLPEKKQKRAHQIVNAAIESLPPLQGFVGFDLVLGKKNDGSLDALIEINPRLTTSYVGLRACCRHNLAAAMLEHVMGKPSELSFSQEPLEFFPDGRVCCPPELESTS